MNLRDNVKGWIWAAVIFVLLGLVGHMEATEARDVVCVPVADPTPESDDRKVPASFVF